MTVESGVVEDIIRLYADKGGATYGEHVTQTEHALQCAALAESGEADPGTVLAALLHDIGHLLDKRGEDAADRGIDTRHEVVGAQWLARYFGPEVSEPVRWHVDAKRYLCATEPAYLDGLSDASKLSLELQGGPFDSARADRFAAQPFADRAIAVRRWDDAGKIEGLRVRDMAGYRPLMRSLLSAGTGRAGC